MNNRITATEAKELYTTLATKHKLPEFASFDSEFEIVDAIQRYAFAPEYPLRFIRRSMLDKFYSWTNYFHGYIQPSQQSIILMQEYGQFTDAERKQILDHVRQLMILTRTGATLDLLSTQEQDVEFIINAFSEWLKVKDKLQVFVKKTAESWKKPIKEDDFEPAGM